MPLETNEEVMSSTNKFPRGWNEPRIRRVIRYYDSQTEDAEAGEIEQAIIADADNPEAWEKPITVPPSFAPRPKSYGENKRISAAPKKKR
jgi:hypothetical protein